MTINNNYNFGMLTNDGGGNLKEIQFTLTTTNEFTLIKGVDGYDLTFSTTGDKGITLTSNLNKPFIVFCYPYSIHFVPCVIKNGSNIGSIPGDPTIHTLMVPSQYNIINFPELYNMQQDQTITLLIID